MTLKLLYLLFLTTPGFCFLRSKQQSDATSRNRNYYATLTATSPLDDRYGEKPVTPSSLTQLSDLSQRPFAGIKSDILRRLPLYKSDWMDGISKRTISAVLFLFFACLAPAVAFGGLTNIITEGNIGVIEFLISCGSSGMLYALISGQPMTFIGPTGLTLAFTGALYRFAQSYNLPFMHMYSWTGIWTSLFLFLGSAFNTATLIKLCTRFTDDCFNALLAINFLYEAIMSICRGFFTPAGTLVTDVTSAIAALGISVITWLASTLLGSLRDNERLDRRLRRVLAGLGPSIVVVLMSLLASSRQVVSRGIHIPKLSVPIVGSFGSLGAVKLGMKVFEDTMSSRVLAIRGLLSVPLSLRMACALPAVLLTLLFFLDHNISIRAVNSCGLRKGEAYHLDLLALSGIILGLSSLGLPWMCGATVQSLAHVQAMGGAVASTAAEATTPSPSTTPQSYSVLLTEPAGAGLGTDSRAKETRLTGFTTHAGVLASVFLLPVIAQIPVSVISGIFIFLGCKIMNGNLFLERLRQLFVFPNKRRLALAPAGSAFAVMPRSQVVKFLSVQSIMLALIWNLKQSKTLALFFPGCIALLALTRHFLIPRMFSPFELSVLDPE